MSESDRSDICEKLQKTWLTPDMKHSKQQMMHRTQLYQPITLSLPSLQCLKKIAPISMKNGKKTGGSLYTWRTVNSK